jgi:glycosyltransferase involved in cell wall biosynthesis
MSKISAENIRFPQADGRTAPPPVRPLQVAQICTSAVRGGAAKAALRLHRALKTEDIKSRLLVAQRGEAEDDIQEYNLVAPFSPVLGRALFRLGRRMNHPGPRHSGAYFTPDWSLIGWRLASQLPPCDLLNLHWVADFLHYHTLPKLAARAPLVWTFHDMNVFTGGCHYSGTCERYTEQCGACPQLESSSREDDMTRRIMKRKQRIFSEIASDRMTVVCPSRWLAREAARSGLCRRFDTRVIPNGVDTQDFHPVDKAEARRRFNLPAQARIVLFVADQIEDRRKGFRFLLKALMDIRSVPDVLLVTLGHGDTSMLTGPYFRHLGPLSQTADLGAAYSAADIFALPSLQDNLPNTVLESMACGTPVAGFDAGGVSEAVIDGQTGLLAPTGDDRIFAANLRLVLEDERRQQALGRESLARIEREFTVKLQARRYAALYREILRFSPDYPASETIPGVSRELTSAVL